MDYFETAKAITRTHMLTYAQARYREGKPICQFCFVPCDARTREYRVLHLCSFCYDELPPPATIKKELPTCPLPLPSPMT